MLLANSKIYSKLLPYSFGDESPLRKTSIILEAPQENLSKLQQKGLVQIFSILLKALSQKSNCEKANKVGVVEVLLRQMIFSYFFEKEDDVNYELLILIIRCLMELMLRSLRAKSRFNECQAPRICHMICTGNMEAFSLAKSSPQRRISYPAEFSGKTLSPRKTYINRYIALLVYRCLKKQQVPIVSAFSTLSFPKQTAVNFYLYELFPLAYCLSAEDDHLELKGSSSSENEFDQNDSRIHSPLSNFAQQSQNIAMSSIAEQRKYSNSSIKKNSSTSQSKSPDLDAVLSTHSHFFPECFALNACKLKLLRQCENSAPFEPNLPGQLDWSERIYKVQQHVISLHDSENNRLVAFPDISSAEGATYKVSAQ
ncbi:hypothetical protein Ciccas_002178 [Cichlidogyrus casuarinus]|uniref:Uncharacterized protein n=1 Tax=Cichlidogyrus casuarinus TaxID=1844966 RepID=A0ABD2QK75_9PLAT